MAETPQGSNNAGNVITWIEKLSSIIKKIGLQNILITIVMLFVVIVVGQVAFNPEGIVKRIETVQKERHEELEKSPLNRACRGYGSFEIHYERNNVRFSV